MKPNYFLLGFPKAGTTTLAVLLGQHPDVFMVPEKEVSFFCDAYNWKRGFEWYEALFDAAGDAPLRGDGSQRYTMSSRFPEVCERLAAYAPEAKLIAMARSPLERIRSFWVELVATGNWRLPDDMDELIELEWDTLVEGTNYWKEINLYRQHFPDEQICIVFFEDFRADPGAVLRTCFTHLGVDPNPSTVDTSLHLNASAQHMKATGPLWIARQSRLFRRAVKIVPSWLADPLRAPFLERAPSPPQWTPTSRARVLGELKDDLEAFLEFYGKPRDFWDLDPAWPGADAVAGR